MYAHNKDVTIIDKIQVAQNRIGCCIMDSQKNSILIVDDESLNITTLSHILGKNYTLYVERDGQGCLESAKELRPDLILLDIIMPAMNGFEVIKRLKADPELCDIPVVFITGLNNTKDEELSFSLGASDYISKPFSAPVVKLRVRNQIQIINHMRSIKKLSIIDILTKISSRRHFNAVLNQEWQRAIRENTHIGFMIVDIDNFEAYNAKYGHVRGDVVLKEVASLIDKHFQGTTCHVARWGGEEFSVVLPDKNLDAVRSIAEEVRNLINSHDFVHENTSSSITVSVGINVFAPENGTVDTLDKFVSETTEALSHFKREGISGVSFIHDPQKR